jgi:MFS family permease
MTNDIDMDGENRTTSSCTDIQGHELSYEQHHCSSDMIRSKKTCNNRTAASCYIVPKVAFVLVAFTLGELGDGLNIFQGIYLVGTGWNEGNVGIALSLMGFTTLLVLPFAGNWVDQTVIDRRIFLGIASAFTALSASTILFVRQGNYTSDHTLIFISKVVEGISSSFIGPCLAALTLANFGPKHFDTIMASNILWGHIGCVVAAILAGLIAFIFYPNVKFCFLVTAAAAGFAIVFIPLLPQGDPLMGRGFEGKGDVNENRQGEQLLDVDKSTPEYDQQSSPVAATYVETITCPKTCLLCVTGLFFQ